MLYFITPQGQEATENKNLNIQGSSRLQSGVQGSRNKFDLSNTYEQHIRPLKENGVDKEPTYFPYINKLPGKVKIVGDKSLRKLISKHHRRWKEKYPSEKFPLDSNIFESNMLNTIKPGPIPGFDSAEYGLVEDRRSISSSSTQITSHNNIRPTMSNYAQASISELGSHASLPDEDKIHERKKKKKRRHEMDYDGERKKKHKHDKEHRKNGTDGEYKKKKRKKEKEKEKEKY